MNRTKKLLALCLSILIVFSVLPMTALADNLADLNGAKAAITGAAIPYAAYADNNAKAAAAEAFFQGFFNFMYSGMTIAVSYVGPNYKVVLEKSGESITINDYIVTVTPASDAEAIAAAKIALSNEIEIPFDTYAAKTDEAAAAAIAAQAVLDDFGISATATVTHDGAKFVLNLTTTLGTATGSIDPFEVTIAKSPDEIALEMAQIALDNPYIMPHAEYGSEAGLAAAAQEHMQLRLDLWGIDVDVEVTHDGTSYTVKLTNAAGTTETLPNYGVQVAAAPSLIPLAKIALGISALPPMTLEIPYGTYTTDAERAAAATTAANAKLAEENIAVTATVTFNGSTFELKLDDGTNTETLPSITLTIGADPDEVLVSLAAVAVNSIGDMLELPYGLYTDAEKAAEAEEILTVFLQEICDIDVDVEVIYTGSIFEVNLSKGNASETVTPFTINVANAPVVPGMPRNVTATAGDGKITLSWTAPRSDGGAAITGYEIIVDGGTQIPVGVVTSYVLTGLTNGTTYSITIAAVNSEGRGAASARVTATPVAPGIPPNPQNPTPNPQPDPIVRPFDDVYVDDWYDDDATYVWENDLMFGTENRIFSPKMNTSRAMIATIMHRMAGTPAGGTETFTDVESGMWYSAAIAWGQTNGIIEGWNGEYRPNDNITRQELAAILSRYARYIGKALPTTHSAPDFADEANISDYAKDAVNELYQAGVIQGKDNNRFDPNAYATRAEVAAMIHRFAEIIK